MFKEGSPIAYDAPAELKKWPSLKDERCARIFPGRSQAGPLQYRLQR